MHFIDQHCAQNLDYNAQATDPGQLSACPAVDDMQTTQSCEGEVAVARTLLRKGPCVLAFYSSGCGLCHSLKEAINNQSQRRDEALPIADVNTDDQHAWALEMLTYDVEHVPCFVLLDARGNAVAKTGAPASKMQMLQSLDALHQLAQQQK